MSPTRAESDLIAVTPALLASVGFSDHSIQRFADRAGLEPARRTKIEPIIRDLLQQEGVLTTQAPHWARSRNAAPYYLQIGEWMLFILRPDEQRPGRYLAVTAINGPVGNDWDTALRRGYLATPPPPTLHPLPQGRVAVRDCLHDALTRRTKPSSPSLPVAVFQAWRGRRARARRDRQSVAEANRELMRLYERARARARHQHAERCRAPARVEGRSR